MSWNLLGRAAVAAFVTAIHLPFYFWDRKKGKHVGFTRQSAPPILFLLFFPPFYFLSRSIFLIQYFLSFLISYAVYSALLLALTPLLRKRYSAELCADLWLLPNISYYLFLFSFDFHKPFVILRVGRIWFLALLGLWMAGFLVVLVWKIFSHFRFRRRLLRRAEQDDHLSYVYVEQRSKILSEKEQERYRLPNREQVVYSPDAVSPLTIGLFKRRIVVPRRYYTDEELDLILRHEATHLIRRDNHTKFFLSFMSACYWFLPNSWIGLSRAAEDLELCCDEIATEDLNPEERKQYAELLLSNAGTAPGFTTCLSASASGLRYRLRRILHPIKAKSGVALLAAVMFLFLFGLQAVGLAPGVGSLDRVAFAKISDPETVVMSFCEEEDRWLWDVFPCDEAALHTVLADIEVYRADGYLDEVQVFQEPLKLAFMVFDGSLAAVITCYESFATVDVYKVYSGRGGVFLHLDPQNREWKRDRLQQTYLYAAAPDWDALYALAEARTID